MNRCRKQDSHLLINKLEQFQLFKYYTEDDIKLYNKAACVEKPKDVEKGWQKMVSPGNVWYEPFNKSVFTPNGCNTKIEAKLLRWCNYSCPRCCAGCSSSLPRETDGQILKNARIIHDALNLFIETTGVPQIELSLIGGEISTLPKELLKKAVSIIVDGIVDKISFIHVVTNLSQPYPYFSEFLQYLKSTYNKPMYFMGSFHEYTLNTKPLRQKFFSKALRLGTEVHMVCSNTVSCENQNLMVGIDTLRLLYNKYLEIGFPSLRVLTKDLTYEFYLKEGYVVDTLTEYSSTGLNKPEVCNGFMKGWQIYICDDKPVIFPMCLGSADAQVDGKAISFRGATLDTEAIQALFKPAKCSGAGTCELCTTVSVAPDTEVDHILVKRYKSSRECTI